MSSNAAIDRLRVLASAPAIDRVKTALLLYVVLTRALKAQRHLRARGVTSSVNDFITWVKFQQRFTMLILRLVPSQKRKLEDGLKEVKADLEAKLVPHGAAVVRHTALPASGQSAEWIFAEMQKMDDEAVGSNEWKHGKMSGAVYHGGDDLTKVLVSAFERYAVSNPLHPDIFPAVRKMEAEIVAMCLRMYNNPDGAGTTTSGGTESIIMSVKTHRDWARETKGITEPEMIVPVSAHAAFHKGAAYLGIKVHYIPIDSYTRQVDLKRVYRAINPNTIMLVGSAVNFPDGCQDDIIALGKLATKYKIGLHVDCCLGSFIVPFLEPAGFPVERFDFRVEGVTAISCDTHKYGFAPKGNSVIMYRDAELRKFQYYVHATWMGGLYASPSIAGSRPGALLAGTWAAMQYMGSEGYLESCRSIVGATKNIAKMIKAEIPELYVLGNPPASVVAFASKHPKVSAHEVGDRMSKKGWHLSAIANPDACHIAVTRLTVPIIDTFIADLKDSVREAKSSPSVGGQMVRLYGLGKSTAVGPNIVGRVAALFLDTLYQA
ncbi:PLP-dependent transferase [Trametopsis cervina]|nr:PLP-dependent transferase [Trametopsis cervina]